jgi:hypothetical protein
MNAVIFGNKTVPAALLVILFLAVAPLSAQQPRLTNAKIETRRATSGLAEVFRAVVAAQAAPAWIGYAVPANNNHQMCCFDYIGGRVRGGGCCWLEKESHGSSIRSSGEQTGDRSSKQKDEQTISLESSPVLFVFARAAGNKVQKVRTFSRDCQIDAGGLPVFWLTDVRSADSVELLAALVRKEHWPELRRRATDEEDDGDDADNDVDDSLGHEAIAAIAFHGDPAADVALEGFVATTQPGSLRKQATFWLGVERGRRGYEVLRRMVHNDLSDGVREQAVFALSQSKVPEAVDAMIDTARNDRSGHVRGQALFWLAQRAGRKAESAITTAIENDPETEVKKKAVFALSQLPAAEGVPLLLQVARSNRNPAVRKQAIFWLGQSNDARALTYFEEILK